MKGQWLGVFKARFDGTITIELDQQGDCYEGWAYLFYDSPKVPCASAYIKTNGLENEQTLTVPTFPLNPLTGVDVEWDSIKKNFDGVDFAKSAEVKISFHNSNLEVSWKTDLGGEGTAVLNRSFASQFSTLDAQSPSSWAEFKTIVSKMVPRQNIFRGQNKGAAWRLRTSFHRTGRYNLRKFLMNDIDELHRSLVNVLPNRFNLSDPDDKGSFVALVQHHGYPTPLLDWSYSPYIAAFFAFEATNSEQSDEKLRVFVFDEKKWDKDWGARAIVSGVRPHFSIIRPLALGNPRMTQQQAVVTLTNVEDLESYIQMREAQKETRYLKGIDLPLTCRDEARRDLEFMGITAATLFPGIDGICRYQKERFF